MPLSVFDIVKEYTKSLSTEVLGETVKLVVDKVASVFTTNGGGICGKRIMTIPEPPAPANLLELASPGPCAPRPPPVLA